MQWARLRFSPRRKYSVEVTPLEIKKVCWIITNSRAMATSSAKIAPTKHSAYLERDKIIGNDFLKIAFYSLCFSEHSSTIVRQQNVYTENHKYWVGVTNWRECKIWEQNESGEAADTSGVEILVIEPSDAAVQEKIVVITTHDAAFAGVAMKCSCRYIFSTAWAWVAIASFRLVWLRSFLIHQKCHLIWFLLLDSFSMTESIQRRPLVRLKFNHFEDLFQTSDFGLPCRSRRPIRISKLWRWNFLVAVTPEEGRRIQIVCGENRLTSSLLHFRATYKSKYKPEATAKTLKKFVLKLKYFFVYLSGVAKFVQPHLAHLLAQ